MNYFNLFFLLVCTEQINQLLHSVADIHPCSLLSIRLFLKILHCDVSDVKAQGQSRFILVKESKTWTEAQSHCRQHYTDLASVRNQSENEKIFSLVSDHRWAVWIGLFRDDWKWSDGSAMSFTNWNTDGINTHNCVATKRGKWKMSRCSDRKYFVCYSAGEL
uniref:C-type lectin domain-containing protein n=1 Tax=Myripristis murdjan TaxID=586833 RepID=A0A668AQT6_9TELE